MAVSRSNRHTKNNRCPVCGGADGDPRGKEKRCFGWTTEDGDWCHCTREELAGSIERGPDGAYAHKMRGQCLCGTTHGTETRVRDEVVATYDYRDERGDLLFQVIRKLGKKFLQRRPDGAGGWVWQVAGVRRVPYRFPELIASSGTVYIVEGEKDVDSLVRIGLVATTNPGGAGKWSLCSDAAHAGLRGREVIVVSDADDAGRDHAREVAADLDGVAKTVRVLVPPQPFKDVSELLSSGGRIEDLQPFEQQTTSEAEQLAPELPFDQIWTAEPDAKLIVPAMGIAPGPTHLVTGSWYTGKTLFLATVGMSVAGGKDVFGAWSSKRGRWIHFDHEMGRRHLKRYVQRVRKGLGVDEEDLRGRMSLRVLPALNLTNEKAIDLYSRLLEGYDIATIDPLRAAAPGADENSSDFRQYQDRLSVVSERTGCSVLVLHHGGKPVEGAARRNTGRGSSGIDDAAQSKFVLTAKEKGAPILVSHEKTRELTQPLDDFYLEIDNSVSDAVRLIHRRSEEVAQKDDRSRATMEAEAIVKTEERILFAIVPEFRGTYKDLRAKIRQAGPVSNTVYEAAWANLVSAGKIQRGGTYREPAWFNRSPSPNRSRIVPEVGLGIVPPSPAPLGAGNDHGNDDA